MKIALGYRQSFRKELPIQTYANSVENALKDLGHETLPFGPGHKTLDIDSKVRASDLILEIETGRNPEGKFDYQVPNHPGLKTKTAVWFIDTHSREDLHASLAPKYNFVFFAPWIKRDVFKAHVSATWLPCATDLVHFGRDTMDIKHLFPNYQFGFHSSKLGLGRADKMVELCNANNWTYDVREVVKGGRHRWNATGKAMRECQNLFNRGQRLDSPNQRIFESMAIGRPLLTDRDPEQRDGMHKLFQEFEHLLYYDRYTFGDLEEKMKWLLNNPVEAQAMADRAYNEVKRKHTVANRVDTILEVISK